MSPSNSEGGVIAELRELLEKATPGPWEANGEGRPIMVSQFDSSARVTEDNGAVRNDAHADAALIAALRNAAPDLLRVVEAVAKMHPYCIDATMHYRDEMSCPVCHGTAWFSVHQTLDDERDYDELKDAAKNEATTRIEHADDCAWVTASKLVGAP